MPWPVADDDTLLRTLFEWTLASLKLPGNARKLKVSLVAIGGYGREELSPHSDIDIMILHNGSAPSLTRIYKHPLLEKLTGTGGLIYTLYDLGPEGRPLGAQHSGCGQHRQRRHENQDVADRIAPHYRRHRAV
ncbi:MAG: hypothetical protein CM1200mP29_14170 [Verrucomicrobiota bacterium]|nr:MAG: hypothetical protein CM1200mP29_14170 [Verrucomicrobiota bacterium]